MVTHSMTDISIIWKKTVKLMMTLKIDKRTSTIESRKDYRKTILTIFTRLKIWIGGN